MIYLIIVIAIIALWLVGAYNSLVKGRVRTDEAWSDIDVQLKRRHDLIPNIVETVKAYAKHEKGVFESVTEARATALGAKSLSSKEEAENALSQTLKSIFAVAEAYPELKASDNFKALQTELSDTEDKIEAARRFYNGNVRDFNIALTSFPTNLIGRSLGFTPKRLFEVEESDKALPQVTFEDDK